MDYRRIVAGLLLVAMVGILIPTPAAAGPLGPDHIEVRSADPGFFARVLERLEQLIVQVNLVFEAREGASIGPNG